MVNNFLTTSNS